MVTGLKISVIAHGALLGIAAFGGALFDAEPKPPPESVSVEIISSAEFQTILAPEIALPSAVGATDGNPDADPLEAAPPAPEPAEQDPIEEVPAVTSDIEQDGVVAPEEVVEATPQAADKISDTITAPEEDPAPVASETAIATVEAPSEAPVETDEQEATAAQATTTQIVTEADKPSDLVPVASKRPKPRPSELKKPEPDPAPEAEPIPDMQDVVADDILKALQEAEAQQDVPQLSGAQQATLVGVIDAHFRQGWSFTGGVEKGQLPIVEMQITVFQDGSYGPEIKRVVPRAMDSLFDQLAVEAAMGAIERGRSSPILLTQEFADFIGPEGKDFIIVFDPRRIENKW